MQLQISLAKSTVKVKIYYTSHRTAGVLRKRIMTEASFRPKRKVGTVVLLVLLVAIGGVAAWTWSALSWSYSEGDRAGVLQKFSKSGWICKTYEGELALYVVAGVAPQIWHFSTRDEKLALQLQTAVGKPIQLHYEEHRGVPTSCFGQTSYFAASFRVVEQH